MIIKPINPADCLPELQVNIPQQFINNQHQQYPEFFTDFFKTSGHDLSSFPQDCRADTLLKMHFPGQIGAPEERFVQLLNFATNFYKELIQSTQKMGETTNKHFHFLLGTAHAKQLRYTIANDPEARMRMLEFGAETLRYLGSDFSEFEAKIQIVHQIAVHVAILRSEMTEFQDFQDFDEADPFVRLFAVCQE
ncbi:hypothetical protein SS50377_22457 [Spironucleus salmonicida]|uniref:Uncharacterized protein n=1 Tax=Spironucleus salmonicida TaxID=348837 RepID=V6LC56_9EUKA|nr:hypothetical protein SS50377_22457 [Spironucleus salmonicida]|eukprot:EST42052.1 hypothetical protein SS50377_18359 [Spironucleus salmonicida]